MAPACLLQQALHAARTHHQALPVRRCRSLSPSKRTSLLQSRPHYATQGTGPSPIPYIGTDSSAAAHLPSLLAVPPLNRRTIRKRTQMVLGTKLNGLG